MTIKAIKNELLWLAAIAGSLILALIILFTSGKVENSLLGILSGDVAIDINLHDNYFVVDFRTLFILIFIAITFLTYAVKEGLKKFSRIFPNFILLLDTILFIVQTIILINTLDQTLISYTVYPPLSALAELETSPPANTIIVTLYSILAVASMLFVFVSLKTIKMISKNKDA